MKKFFYTLLVLLAIALVGVVTCPDKEAHSAAMMNLINVGLSSEMSKSDMDENIALFTATLGSGLFELIINKTLVVDNYFVFSKGRLVYDGESTTVSLGVFNHVFTMSEEEFLRRLEEADL